MTNRRLSIVVPALDEAGRLPALLDHLAELPGCWEVIVVDGGSTDDSRAVAMRHPLRPVVLRSRRGRAVQMNEGAWRAAGEAIVFLHADTTLPRDAHAQLCRALDDPAVDGGNFAVRFDGRDRFSRVLTRWYALQRRAGVYYGDSAIWLRRSAFAQMGGYRELPIMEDHELARRLERAGGGCCLPGPVTTSARRWQRLGLARTIVSWTVIRWLYYAGAPPARLAALYPHAR